MSKMRKLREEITMNEREALTYIAHVLCWNSMRARVSSRELPILEENSLTIEAKDTEAAFRLGVLMEYKTCLAQLDIPTSDGKFAGEPGGPKFP